MQCIECRLSGGSEPPEYAEFIPDKTEASSLTCCRPFDAPANVLIELLVLPLSRCPPLEESCFANVPTLDISGTKPKRPALTGEFPGAVAVAVAADDAIPGAGYSLEIRFRYYHARTNNSGT